MYSFEKGHRPLNPYVAGVLTGLLGVASVALSGKFFGASTSFARIGAVVMGWLSPDHAQALMYFRKYSFVVDWQLLFLGGILIGALLSSTLNGTFFIEGIPDLWRERFGGRTFVRLLVAFFGGVLAAFGARMAGGCPSGHGLSGVMQLSLSGVVALGAFALGGVVTARILYGRS